MTERRHPAPRDPWGDFRTRWRSIIRDLVWVVDCDDEDTGDPSLMKVMAVVFALAAVHGGFVHDRALTMIDVAMGFLGACTYCGYRGLKIFGKRNGNGHAPPADPAPLREE